MAINNHRLSAAIGIALSGILEIKRIHFTCFNHKFNVKGIILEDLQEGIKVDEKKGHHISHHRSNKSDQQIYYSCKISKIGEIQDIWVNDESSTLTLKKWFETFKIKALVSTIIQDSFKYEFQNGPPPFWPEIEAAPNTNLLLDGSWRGDVECLIANIIIYSAVFKIPEIGKFPVLKIPLGLVERLTFQPNLRMGYIKRMTTEFGIDEDPEIIEM